MSRSQLPKRQAPRSAPHNHSERLFRKAESILGTAQANELDMGLDDNDFYEIEDRSRDRDVEEEGEGTCCGAKLGFENTDPSSRVGTAILFVHQSLQKWGKSIMEKRHRQTLSPKSFCCGFRGVRHHSAHWSLLSLWEDTNHFHGHSQPRSIRRKEAERCTFHGYCSAADDGVMPQTVEAIKHANAANGKVNNRKQMRKQFWLSEFLDIRGDPTGAAEVLESSRNWTDDLGVQHFTMQYSY
ncbi:hypothetical protein BJ742DRAFT_736617 [Cladochytrium replicatum]|nr:hypothetical protein BJ742DRAFT_736617 [Cladochytrium replicatum]